MGTGGPRDTSWRWMWVLGFLWFANAPLGSATEHPRECAGLANRQPAGVWLPHKRDQGHGEQARPGKTDRAHRAPAGVRWVSPSAPTRGNPCPASAAPVGVTPSGWGVAIDWVAGRSPKPHSPTAPCGTAAQCTVRPLQAPQPEGASSAAVIGEAEKAKSREAAGRQHYGNGSSCGFMKALAKRGE